MKLRPNAIAWNPIEPFTFVVASDDYKYVLFVFIFLYFGQVICKSYIIVFIRST